ncbi:MAG: metallophosphoesterase [Bacteroidales bacterium]
MKRFVIGDIHGAHKALKQCLERSCFDYSNDLLICLGDVSDGFPEVPQCMDELLKIKNLVFLLGNHDLWFRQWVESGARPETWVHQGGSRTIKSYRGKPDPAHAALLRRAKQYHLEGQMLFVHGGIEPGLPLEDQDEHTLLWDRKLVMEACAKKDQSISITGYQKVFVGHTPTVRFKSMVPVSFCEVVLMDTGAGWGQKLSIMNIDSGELFQSDPTLSLYGISYMR